MLTEEQIEDMLKRVKKQKKDNLSKPDFNHYMDFYYNGQIDALELILEWVDD